MFLIGRGILASCPRQGETRDKRVPVVAAGSGPLAGKLAPEYPSGQDVSLSEEESHQVAIFYRKENSFQGPKLGCCLTLRNESSEETHVLTKQEILFGRGPRVESSRVRKPRRTVGLRGSQSQFYGDGISFQLVFGHHSNSESFPVAHTSLSQDGC